MEDYKLKEIFSDLQEKGYHFKSEEYTGFREGCVIHGNKLFLGYQGLEEDRSDTLIKHLNEGFTLVPEESKIGFGLSQDSGRVDREIIINTSNRIARSCVGESTIEASTGEYVEMLEVFKKYGWKIKNERIFKPDKSAYYSGGLLEW